MPSKKRTLTVIAFALGALMLATSSASQQAKPAASPPIDPQIAAALKDISAAQIQHNIEALVGFNTRQTLSAGMPGMQNGGIDAAADWIKGEFMRYSSQCGDCLEVRTDQFIQQPATRVPE